jgi:hypothetical protein
MGDHDAVSEGADYQHAFQLLILLSTLRFANPSLRAARE